MAHWGLADTQRGFWTDQARRAGCWGSISIPRRWRLRRTGEGRSTGGAGARGAGRPAPPALLGEGPPAWRGAKAIVSERPIHGTLALARIVVREARRSRPGVHPARRTFQARRVAATNQR